MIAARYFCCAAASTRYAAKRESRNMSDINGSKPTNFPLDESKLDFKIPRTDAPRENVLKLGSMITNRIGLKATADDPEYWGLAGVMTDEMVDVALKMGVRKPKTTEQLMKLTKMEREPLEKLLTEMAWTGIIEYNWENLDGKNPKHEKRWVLPLFVPGSAEFLNMRKSQIDEHPEVAAFFERMTMLPLEKITPMVPPGGAGIGMHVIPVEKAIETENESVDLEHISYWLSKYEGKYAKSMCSCRASRAKLGEGCGDDAESWCIGVGDMADYIVETQRGEYITKDETLEIFKKAEDNGFVHQITNIDGEQKIFGICNCNVNVCNALRTSQLFNTPNLSRSAYVASVESESCVACGRCVENCPAGAVKLGQKLCTKDGYIEYPRQELPDDVKWGPEKWSVDYRDRNRINCYNTGTSPCKTACPAHIAVQGYLKFAAQGKYREALQLIKRENPFPAVCGRICNRRCEDACTRGTVDQAVAIDEVKRFIAQQDLNAETRFVPEKVIPKVDGEFSEKIAVIGGGPAGLSCAYYLAEKGYRPTVFEREARPGGMLMNGIPSFRLEKDVVEAEIDILRELGVEFRCGVEVGKDVTIAQLREQGYQGNLEYVRGEYDFLVNKYAAYGDTAVELDCDAWLIHDEPTDKAWHNAHLYLQASRKSLTRAKSMMALMAMDHLFPHLSLIASLATLAYAILMQDWILTGIAGFALLLLLILRTVIAHKAIKHFDDDISLLKLPFYEYGIIWRNLANKIRYWRADKNDFTSHKL